ncbi:peroxisome assembly protein 12-like [Leptopilina boulardi]|uniref:peroxisome assembly protein 12-like n=1 Tax=Leptopilina boulardi TaxID=63433 RepID=UPI0021F638FD|nr:peroxisome assembly protein 12-like [Leptopilina boulardi]
MGEKGVHLTGTSYSKPSIFEIGAQDLLSLSLEPAFNKLLTVLANLYPAKFGTFLRWKDETFMLLNGALQHYYLCRHSASFSEKFYGLKRVSLKNSNTITKLSKNQKQASLILLILFPYLNKKLDALRKKYSLELSSPNCPKLKRRLITVFISIYYICDTIREILKFQNLLLYTAGKSKYTSPFLKIFDITLSYSFMNPSIIITDLFYKIKKGTFTLKDGGTILEEVAVKSLEIAAFIFRFLQYWDKENYDKSLIALPTPAAPPITEKAKQFQGLCPICKKPFRTRTAVATSGYIFCYLCILPVIQRYGKCPITNYPAIEDDLIRLYEQ